jgi:hypothetical protein
VSRGNLNGGVSAYYPKSVRVDCQRSMARMCNTRDGMLSTCLQDLEADGNGT